MKEEVDAAMMDKELIELASRSVPRIVAVIQRWVDMTHGEPRLLE